MTRHICRGLIFAAIAVLGISGTASAFMGEYAGTFYADKQVQVPPRRWLSPRRKTAIAFASKRSTRVPTAMGRWSRFMGTSGVRVPDR